MVGLPFGRCCARLCVVFSFGLLQFCVMCAVTVVVVVVVAVAVVVVGGGGGAVAVVVVVL